MYGCDCDGVQREPLDHGREGDAIRGTLRVIEKITGHRPPTCPWRAYYEPIVREVMDVAWSVDDGNLAATLGPDPDAVLRDAIGVYRRALSLTKAEEERLAREDAERKRRHNAAARGGRGH